MKLVEILARELKEWPRGYKYIAQDGYDLDCQVAAYKCKPSFANRLEGEWGVKGVPGFEYYYPEIEVSDLATDHATAIVTREMWKAEKARIAKPAKKANKDGWIRHRGGKCPVDKGVLVDVRYRKEMPGLYKSGQDAYRYDWIHSGQFSDIMAYRLHTPVIEPAVAENVEGVDKRAQLVMSEQQVGRVSRSPSDVEITYDPFANGPLQWRDRIREIDCTVESLEEERVSLVQRLEDEGFRLIDKVNAGIASAMQAHEDMGDWRNWKDGDLVMCVSDKRASCENMTAGNTYMVTTKFGSTEIIDDDGDAMGSVVTSNRIKFHSRPST